jgi:regulator of protease activity HflC (stomatin/prohibitin superfamily)
MMYTVPQAHCVVIERFGKFSRIQREGLQFKLPFVEHLKRVETWGPIANKGGHVIELTEQQTNTPTRHTHTKDNVSVATNASVYWRIVDPRRALYEIDNLPAAVADIALNALRSNIGMLELDAVLSERARLNERIAAELSETAAKWGIQFTRVEIQEITTTDETARVMSQQMDAERKRRALIAEAEGRAIAEVRVAQAERDAAVLRAEGQAKALGLLAEAEAEYLARLQQVTSRENAAAILIAGKYLAGFDTITRNPADKVFLPANFQPLLTLPLDVAGNPGAAPATARPRPGAPPAGAGASAAPTPPPQALPPRERG